MRCKRCIVGILLVLTAALLLAGDGFGQSNGDEAVEQAADTLTLTTAVMCEGIKDLAPYQPAIVFSIAIGRVSFYTAFDPVPEKTFIYHKWYHNDRPSTQKKLYLTPPRWASYSSIQLRETDKGPWRVELCDAKGNILQVLRFSITD